MPYNRQKMENALLALIGTLECGGLKTAVLGKATILTCSIACTNKA